ncbi:MAG: DUF2304 domain-containing protein [Micrococcales bacterium]|nr:DUF2304 domain-containing protein [Micrococcales bacterium]
MNVIRIALIVLVVLTAGLLLRGQGARHQAVRRLGLVAFALLAVAAVIFPDATTVVANWIGVGRGADLLLYVLLVAFFGYVAGRYFHDKRQNRHLTALARRLTLAQAPPPRGLLPPKGQTEGPASGKTSQT